jgi:hypothetical protein
MSFPSQGTGTSQTQVLTLTNAGTADTPRGITGTLSITSVALDIAADFQITSNSCAAAGAAPTLALNASCSVAVTFNPTTTGARTAKQVFRDTANNSPVQVIALNGAGVDAQAPTVTAPAQTFVVKSPLSTNTVSVIVTSTATDASGVGAMTLEQSTDGGRTWTAVSPAPTVVTATSPARLSATLVENLSTAYQYRATATDALGNKSAPVVSATNRMSLTDDSSGTPRFNGSWSAQRNNTETAGTIGSTLHIATAPPAGKTNTATFTFTGTEVALVSTLGPDRGQATISVDGSAPQLIDLYAAGAAQKTIVAGSVSGLASGTHTVTINVLTTKNAASSGTRVDVDAFLVKF